MFHKSVQKFPKIWHKFTKKSTVTGQKMHFRWEQLSKKRYEDFIDFHINYFVKQEVTYLSAGFSKDPEILEKYRNHAISIFQKPLYNIFICCVDDEKQNIVAYDSVKLIDTNDLYTNDFQAQNKELNKCLQIIHNFNEIFSTHEVIKTCAVNRFMEDVGCAVHSDYRGYGIVKEISLQRCMVCKEFGVPLTGAWFTSQATQKVAEREGWETLFEKSCREIETELGIHFVNPPPTFIYSVKRIL